MEHSIIEKVILPISECLPGMKIMQSIVDLRTGTTIVGKGQILTQESIEKVKNFEHSQIWIVPQEETSVWETESQILEDYKAYTEALKGILEWHKEAKEDLALEQVIDLADRMVTDFKEEYDILSCVHSVSQLERDDYAHSVHVAFLSLIMGKWEGYDEEKLKDLVLAALLHDVGKIMISPELISKKEAEMDLIEKLEYRRHTIYGYEKLAGYQEMSTEALKGVLSHHERCDGSGYPLSIKESKINDIAKVIGLVDTYEMLRRQYHIFDVVKKLSSTMLRKFDVHLLFEFCSNIMNYYVGASVLLSNGEVGEVLFIQPQAWGRPIVEVNGKTVNLHEKNCLHIVKVL